MHTTQRWRRYNTKHRNNKIKGIAYFTLMDKLWKDVYWLYTADILPCYNGIELYTPLYVTFICAYPVKVTIDIYESPRESPWGSRKIQGIADRSARGCAYMCASVCGYEGVPIFLWNQHYDYWRTVAYLATRSFVTTLFTQQWRLQLYQVKRMILLSEAGASVW